MINKFKIGIASLLLAGPVAHAQTRTASSAAASAGDKYVSSALTFLKANNPDEARQEIDKAFTPADTKASPKALLAKAQIYFALNATDKYKDQGLYKEGTKALIKLVDTKPEFERGTVDALLMAGAYMYYNEGAKAYNDKKLGDAPDLMRHVTKIHDLAGGKRFDKFPNAKQFDSVAADATQIMASSAYYTGKYDEAIPLLINVKNNPISRTPSAFENLIYAYNIQKNSTSAYAVIMEARKAFPDDMTIRNYELDYFVNSGRQDELIKKSDAALAKDPQNADLLFNEGVTYMNMASTADPKKPEGASELYAKSESAFRKALAISPDNTLYNYSFGTLYYNQATELNDQMNAIKGISEADQKKQDALKNKADALFGQAAPYFEKAYASLAGNAGSLRDEDKKAYRSTLLALKEIYIAQNKKDKADDMKKKYEAYN